MTERVGLGRYGKAKTAKLKKAKHGMCYTPEYYTWTCMKYRCSNPRDASYPLYGARGIKVCDRWLGKNGFQNFYADMGPRPGPNYSIDRVDNDGPYSPDNCRWASAADQTNNRRVTIKIEIDGVVKSLTEWSRHFGVHDFTARWRYYNGKRGMDLFRAVQR